MLTELLVDSVDASGCAIYCVKSQTCEGAVAILSWDVTSCCVGELHQSFGGNFKLIFMAEERICGFLTKRHVAILFLK
jgi:hypothetical protein